MLVTFEAITFLDIAKIALKRNISRRFLAGEEGFEPSAYGFGGFLSKAFKSLRRNGLRSPWMARCNIFAT